MKALTVALMLLLCGAAGAAELSPAWIKIECTAPGNGRLIRDQLYNKYKEAPILQGITKDRRAVFSVWRNGDSTAWTAILSSLDGSICLIAHGDDIDPVIWFLPN